MAVVALIEPPQAELIEKILSHCGLWRSAAIKAVMQFQIYNKQQTAQCHQFLGYSQLGAASTFASTSAGNAISSDQPRLLKLSVVKMRDGSDAMPCQFT